MTIVSPNSPTFSAPEIIFTATSNNANRHMLLVAVRSAGVEIGSELRRWAGATVLRINMSGYVHTFLSATRPQPRLDGAEMLADANGAAARFSFDFELLDANNASIDNASNVLFVVRGTVDNEVAWMRTALTQRHWLSLYPGSIAVVPGQVIFGAWLLEPRSGCQLMARFFWPNGQSAVTPLSIMSGIETVAGVKYVSVAWAHLTAAAGDTFTAFDLFFRSLAHVNISNLRRFVVLGATRLDRTLIFENSVGGWDSLLIRGNIETGVIYERETASSSQFVRTTHTNRRHTYNINSGYVGLTSENPTQMANYIAHEVLASRQIYMRTQTNLVEIRIVSDSITKIYDDLDMLMSIEFNAQSVRIVETYTMPDIALPPAWAPSQDNYFEDGYINPGYYE